jgi:ABC-type antimicrobial peptide transport system permease subunit
MTVLTAAAVLLVAAFIGAASALVPSYRASRLRIVDALRYIG